MFKISDRIRYYRKKKGLTQMAVASALEIRTDNYAKYESGTRVPKDDRLVALAGILGVSYNALLFGIPQEFAGLLSRHAIGAVLGDVDSFRAFACDMENSSEAYAVITESFNKGAHYFKKRDADYYRNYIEMPDLTALFALYDTYKKQCEPELNQAIVGQPTDESVDIPALDALATAKWAFCIAVRNYLDSHDAESILQEAGEIAGNLDALQFFAVKVFVPYLAFIIDAVELCTNTTMDDFEISFLFDTLTPPVNDEQGIDSEEE